jgi:hypothetical protein
VKSGTQYIKKNVLVLFKRNMFQHPKSVCLTYTEHFKFSMYLSYQFAKASLCAIIHAVYPDVYVTHSHDTVHRIQSAMQAIGCRED